LAAGVLIPRPERLLGQGVIAALSTPVAMAFAVGFVIAWHWERIGAWAALASGAGLIAWLSIRAGGLALSARDLLFVAPALLFLFSSFLCARTADSVAQLSGMATQPRQEKKWRRYFAPPRSDLGWWSLIIGAGFFAFMRLFWMQAFSPGRDRSTFFSDPINAACLIGALGSAIAGMVLAVAAIIWKRERSLWYVPLLLLGFFALFWSLAVLSGANA